MQSKGTGDHMNNRGDVHSPPKPDRTIAKAFAIGVVLTLLWALGNLCTSPRFERDGLQPVRKRRKIMGALAAEGMSNTCADLP
jgi:hypothetical protein